MTDATRYISIYAPAGERHAGVWSTSKYRLVQATTGSEGGVLRIQIDYTRVTGIQIQNTAGSPGVFDCGLYHDAGVNCTFTALILRDGYYGAYLNAAGTLLTNSVAYGAARAGMRHFSSSGTFADVYNCTCIGAVYGLESSSSVTFARAKNVYTHGGTSGFTQFVSKTNCASSDTSATDNSGGGGATNCINSVAHSIANFTNVTAGSENYHLVSGSALIDVGVDLSGTFTLDIDGDARGATWDIGADEFVAGAAAGQPYSARVRGVPGMNYGGKIFTGRW